MSASTLTLTALVSLLDPFWQSSLYWYVVSADVAARGPVVYVPWFAFAPVHGCGPMPVQEVASWTAQLIVTEDPSRTEMLGPAALVPSVAVITTVGSFAPAGAVTVSGALANAVAPPAPVHVNPN